MVNLSLTDTIALIAMCAVFIAAVVVISIPFMNDIIEGVKDMRRGKG